MLPRRRVLAYGLSIVLLSAICTTLLLISRAKMAQLNCPVPDKCNSNHCLDVPASILEKCSIKMHSLKIWPPAVMFGVLMVVLVMFIVEMWRVCECLVFVMMPVLTLWVCIIIFMAKL